MKQVLQFPPVAAQGEHGLVKRRPKVLHTTCPNRTEAIFQSSFWFLMEWFLLATEEAAASGRQSQGVE